MSNESIFSALCPGVAVVLCDGAGCFLSHVIVQEVIRPGQGRPYGDILVEEQRLFDSVRMTFRYVDVHPELPTGWYRPPTIGAEKVRTVTPEWQQDPSWDQRGDAITIPYQLKVLS